VIFTVMVLSVRLLVTVENKKVYEVFETLRS